MKCILLVRVSTEVQSFDEQEKELIDLALKHGYSINDIKAVSYKESAIKLNEDERAGLNEMKALIETGQYNCVFAWEISRIARKKKILFNILDDLVEKKIQLVIKEPSIILLNPNGEINEAAETMFTLYAQIAESEMRNKIARFKRAKKEYYNMGKYMGGTIKLGYKVNENGFWKIDEEGGKLITTIFELYNSGEYSLRKLSEELKSRGYFSHLSITNIKTTIHSILSNPIYKGERTSNNLFPAIIDEDTWNKCVAKRRENLIIPKAKGQYLLTPLIRCQCGGSYFVLARCGTYRCRVRNNSVEKNLEHSPDINGNMIESIAWYVALQELHQEMTMKDNDFKENCEKDILLLKEKIAASQKNINMTEERRLDLDEAYYVTAKLSKERYDALTEKQNEIIRLEQEKIKGYNQSIKNLKRQIDNASSLNEMFENLSASYDSLKYGTDYESMKKIIHRYIKEIKIYPIDGKHITKWKRVVIKTINEEENLKNIEYLRTIGLNEAAIVLGTNFIVDVYHHKVYWDEELQYEVPFVYMDRIPRKRKSTKKIVKENNKNH